MNKQDKGNGSKGIEWTDWTFNPVGGCFHDCSWKMPDGSVANCYAEDSAASVQRQSGGKNYAFGFKHHYFYPNRLGEPLKEKTPSKIFVCSMADLFGHWVPDDQIQQVLDICEQAHWHTFQLLTKNAPRLLKFEFPANVWVGASVPPSFMMGRELSHEQQVKMLIRTLDVLKQVNAPVKWMSIEPLSWDVAPLFDDCGLRWMVIGAASNGRKYYQPKPEWVEGLLNQAAQQQIPVFFKGNLEWSPRFNEFPVTPTARGK
jgi:protein gp37